MSTRGTDHISDGCDDVVAALAARWGSDPRIGPLLAAADGPLLVLDGTLERLLHARGAAMRLRSGIARPDSQLDDSLGLRAQLLRAGLGLDRPALARLQFDSRRIQAPVTCIVARAILESGETVVGLVLTGPLPRLRAIGAAPDDAPAETPVPSTATDVAQVPDIDGPSRFTWRSDADDRIVSVAGPAGAAVAGTMTDRSWQSLAQSGVLSDADGLLVALAAKRTFRAIPLIVHRAVGHGALELELSGAPLARSGQPFAGYGGFGILRPQPLEASADPSPAAPDEATASRNDIVVEPDLPSPSASSAPPLVPAPAVLVALPSPQAEASGRPEHGGGDADAHLSGDEHDAFREIARALGARFAGDAAPSFSLMAHDGPSGSVMPFPVPAPRPAEDALQAVAPSKDAMTAILDGLPAGILVCRGASVLFANRALLDLGRFEDIIDIAMAGGLTRLFHGLDPEDLADTETPAVLAAVDGASVGIAIQRTAIAWEGVPAALLLVRPVDVNDPAEALAAERVAQDFAGRRSAETLAILDSLDDGILTTDAGGRILSLNQRATAMFGLDPREVVGAGLVTLFTRESAVEVLSALKAPAEADDGGTPHPRDVVARGRDGAIRLRLRSIPLAAAGEPRRVVVLRQETAPVEMLRPRRAAETENALRADFLAKLSHQVRAPLDDILAHADAMLAERFGPLENERYRDAAREIRASGDHVLGLVGGLFDLATIEAGRMQLAFTEVPLNAIVSSCVALMQPQAARDRIVIRTSFSESLTRLVADERSVRQAALNIIANAIRFTEAGGQVIVSTTMADRGEIALRVRDTGIGMTPVEVETALAPFRDGPVAEGKPGAGLGLPLTKALVEANRGRFRITSRKDEGTLVEMLFPAEQALSA